MKKILLILIILFTSLSLSGQEFKAMDADPSKFLGKWTATSGEYTYELTIIRDTAKVWEQIPDINILLEQISCRMVYKRGNTVVRTIEPDGIRSMISGVATNETSLRMKFNDKDRKIDGHISFEIDSNYPNKASWELTKRGLYITPPGGAEDFDIPRYLTFRKIPNVNQGDPGGDIGSGAQL